MNEFFRLLVAELHRIGITNVEIAYHGAGYITVAGCIFNADHSRGRQSIKFLGGYFRTPYTNKSIGKAAALLLGALPERLKRLRERQAEEKHREEARVVNRSLAATKCLSVYPAGDGGFVMDFKHHDKLTVMAAADCLQDGGFCDACPPTVDEQDFGVTQEGRTIEAIRKLLTTLPPQTRADFIRQMARRAGLISEDEAGHILTDETSETD